MPAHRSEAEAEIRVEVVRHLRAARPIARIIHEINVCQGGNRIDVLAVDVEEIIAVEIKSKKDKIDRLPAQMEAMTSVAHHSIAAIHEKFLVEWGPASSRAAHYERDGEYYMGEPPKCCGSARETWVYPIRRRSLDPEWELDRLAKWSVPQAKMLESLPAGALDMLWRDELQWVCFANQIAAGPRSTRGQMMHDLRWLCSGKELPRGICAALRARQCVEADDPVPLASPARA